MPTEAASIEVAGYLDNNSAKLFINDIPVMVQDRLFRHQVDLAEGENTIAVKAIDPQNAETRERGASSATPPRPAWPCSIPCPAPSWTPAASSSSLPPPT